MLSSKQLHILPSLTLIYHHASFDLELIHYKIYYNIQRLSFPSPHQLLIASLFNWKRHDQDNEAMKE